MNKQELRAQLEELYAELRRTKSVDHQQRELLRTLTIDIQELLSREENQPHHYSSLRARLNEAVAALEASHPQISLLMRQAIDSLAPLGI